MQMLQQMQAAHQQLASELIASRADMARMMDASDRKLEHRGKQWDDTERYKNSVGFAGKVSEWHEWSDRLLGTVKSRSTVVYDVMLLVEHKLSEKLLESDGYETVISAVDDAAPDADEVALIGAKLHRLLIDLTTGDANAVVRRSRNANGLLAWRRLSASLNPKTLASGLKCINAAHNPPRILDVRQIDVQVEEWQSKLEKLAAEYGETISSRVKLAIFVRDDAT